MKIHKCCWDVHFRPKKTKKKILKGPEANSERPSKTKTRILFTNKKRCFTYAKKTEMEMPPEKVRIKIST
jgi:hypothetical protein